MSQDSFQDKYKKVSDSIKKYNFNGKTISEWRKHFSLKIPQEVDSVVCQRLSAKVCDYLQEAVYYKTEASTAYEFLKTVRDKDISLRSKELLEGSTKISISKVNILCVDEGNEGALTLAKVVFDFWKEVVDHLNQCRKILETITVNESTLARITKESRV